MSRGLAKPSVGTDTEFFLELSKGNVGKHSVVDVRGYKPSATTSIEVVWDGNGSYAFFPPSDTSLEIVSDNDGDKPGGHGVYEILVTGLNDQYVPISETVTLNGTTPVNLDTKFWRIREMKSVSVSGSLSNTGTITLRGQGGGATGAIMLPGENITHIGVYYVPSGKTGYLQQWWGAIAGTADYSAEMCFARIDEENIITLEERVQVNTTSQTYFQRIFPTPLVIPEKKVIALLTTASASDTIVSGGMTLILVDT